MLLLFTYRGVRKSSRLSTPNAARHLYFLGSGFPCHIKVQTPGANLRNINCRTNEHDHCFGNLRDVRWQSRSVAKEITVCAMKGDFVRNDQLSYRKKVILVFNLKLALTADQYKVDEP